MVTTSPAAPETASTTDTDVKADRRKYRIPTEKVRAGLRELPEDQRDDVLWFHRHCLKVDPDKKALSAMLRKPGGTYYSADSISQLLTGFRASKGEPTETIWQAIVALRRIEEPRAENASAGFIETRMFFEIERRCLRALQRNRIQFIFGDSQIGKTANLKEVARRHNHGQTIYVEVPAGGSLGKLLRSMAAALDIRIGRNQHELEEAILASLDNNNLLILDEAHRFFEGRSKFSGMASLSFLRQLYNERGCGMVLSMTNEGRQELLNGRHKKALEQMWRRRCTPLQLPAFPPDDDAEKFAHAYKLPTAPDEIVKVKVTAYDDRGREKELIHQDNPLRLQRAVLQTEGLGVWIEILQDASDMARTAGKPVTWAAVLKAHAQAQADAEIFN